MKYFIFVVGLIILSFIAVRTITSNSLLSSDAFNAQNPKQDSINSAVATSSTYDTRVASTSQSSSLPAIAHRKNPSSSCLPTGIMMSSVVGTEMISFNNIRKITVGQTLKKLGAYCADNKLFDQNGISITFYNLTGCWGHLPSNADEILAKQAADIALLKKSATVIEMTCNSSGFPLQ